MADNLCTPKGMLHTVLRTARGPQTAKLATCVSKAWPDVQTHVGDRFTTAVLNPVYSDGIGAGVQHRGGEPVLNSGVEHGGVDPVLNTAVASRC